MHLHELAAPQCISRRIPEEGVGGLGVLEVAAESHGLEPLAWLLRHANVFDRGS
jgi:hypothetical protein